MRPSFRTVLAALALALGGCATTALDYKGPDAGYVVASLSIPKKNFGFSSGCLRVRQKGDQGAGKYLCMQQNAPVLRDDLRREYEVKRIEDGDYLGGVAVRALPAGQYEVIGYSLSQGQERSISPDKPLAIPFTVRPGANTYIGQYQWNFTMGKDPLFGNEVVKGARTSITNRLQRDMEKAAALRGISTAADSAVPSSQER